MEVSPDKFHLLLSDKNIRQVDICNERLSSENLLKIKIDNKLTFEENVEGLCKKINQKINGLTRISSLIRSSHQRCSVKKVFLEISQKSQENTCDRVSFSMKLQASGLQLY